MSQAYWRGSGIASVAGTNTAPKLADHGEGKLYELGWFSVVIEASKQHISVRISLYVGFDFFFIAPGFGFRNHTADNSNCTFPKFILERSRGGVDIFETNTGSDAWFMLSDGVNFVSQLAEKTYPSFFLAGRLGLRSVSAFGPQSVHRDVLFLPCWTTRQKRRRYLPFGTAGWIWNEISSLRDYFCEELNVQVGWVENPLF